MMSERNQTEVYLLNDSIYIKFHLYKITKQAKITDGDRCQNSDNLWDWGGELAKMLEMLYILLWVVVVWVHTHELEFLWQLSGNESTCYCRR